MKGWGVSVVRLGPGQLGEFSMSDGRDVTSGTMGSDEGGRMEINLGKKQDRTGETERLIISKLLVTSRVGGKTCSREGRGREEKRQGTEASFCSEFPETRKIRRHGVGKMDEIQNPGHLGSPSQVGWVGRWEFHQPDRSVFPQLEQLPYEYDIRNFGSRRYFCV